MVLLRCQGEAVRCLEDIERAVKCPKCGFVSYPGIPQCKKCGHPFVVAGLKTGSPSALSISPPSPSRPTTPSQNIESPIPFSPPLRPKSVIPAEVVSPEIVEPGPAPLAEGNTQTAAWREELSGRLEDFRRKRARVKGSFDPSTSLDLDFGRPEDESPDDAMDALAAEPSRGPVDFDFALSAQGNFIPGLDSVPLERSGKPGALLNSAASGAGETTLRQAESEADPVEIILESPPSHLKDSVPRAMHGALHVAPLGGRFVAALADGLVLLMGGGLFALIVWAAGGHISVRPLNIMIVGFIAALFVLSYFGLFTALSSSTPGLLWMNLEVRSLDGSSPTPQESFWRAFGYLVSFASLLLGFVWALVDGDHLTWHDHMSGTFISPIGS